MTENSKKKNKPTKDSVIIKVEPLRSKEEIEDFKWALRYTGGERDVMLFTIGVNTGLRVSDIVPLKVSEVRGKTHLILREKKTGKEKKVLINSQLQKDIMQYTKRMGDDDFLFPSQMTDSYITPTQAYRVMQKAAKLLERDDIGTHTMRKTFGYMYYKNTRDIVSLQILFNHSSPTVTLRYIGITAEELDKSMEDFYL